MFNRSGERTDDTCDAFVVHLTNEDAAGRFLAMIQSNPNESQDAADKCGVFEDDWGWYYWDEFEEHYRWIDEDIVNALIAANHQIN